jgi:hypothetical protein
LLLNRDDACLAGPAYAPLARCVEVISVASLLSPSNGTSSRGAHSLPCCSASPCTDLVLLAPQRASSTRVALRSSPSSGASSRGSRSVPYFISTSQECDVKGRSLPCGSASPLHGPGHPCTPTKSFTHVALRSSPSRGESSPGWRSLPSCSQGGVPALSHHCTHCSTWRVEVSTVASLLSPSHGASSRGRAAYLLAHKVLCLPCRIPAPAAPAFRVEGSHVASLSSRLGGESLASSGSVP